MLDEGVDRNKAMMKVAGRGIGRRGQASSGIGRCCRELTEGSGRERRALKMGCGANDGKMVGWEFLQTEWICSKNVNFQELFNSISQESPAVCISCAVMVNGGVARVLV